MVKTALQFVILYVLMVLTQVIVFNHICLFGYAVPLVFIYVIIKLPVTLNVNWVLTLSFLLGLTIDIFSDTQGMNSLACTILGILRKPVLHLYFPREDEMSTPQPLARRGGISQIYIFHFAHILHAVFPHRDFFIFQSLAVIHKDSLEHAFDFYHNNCH